MITPPDWYKPIEKVLDQSYPIMVVLALLIVGVTLWLTFVKRNPGLLALWLTYLYMP